MAMNLEGRRGTSFVFYMALWDGSGALVLDPDIEAGDFVVSTGGAPFVSLLATPVVDPAGGYAVRVELSASEMDGESIVVVARDQVGGQWRDELVFVGTHALSGPLALTPRSIWDWQHRTLTQPVAQSGISPSVREVSRRRGDDWRITFEGVSNLVGRQALWFTVKISFILDDADSILLVREGQGLLVLYNAPVEVPSVADADIVVDEDEGVVTVVVSAGVTAQLGPSNRRSYDVQLRDGDGLISTPIGGQFIVLADITRTTGD